MTKSALPSVTRRTVLRSAAASAVAMALGGRAHAQPAGRAVTRGRLRQSVSRWCYQKMALPNLITFFGNREGRSDRQAIDACVTGLNRLKAAAEHHGITVCVELLNSKVNHAHYHGDRTTFGVEIVAAVNSPRVKLLYDIYHMQIMEGDVIRAIAETGFKGYLAHEFVPTRDPMTSLREAVVLCDV